ncbi:MAG: 2-oxoacid:acceptor oxidoreductase family protein [Acidobacteriia bacterium]|nr:2-oxoacid:acceptor oxidoreductase family protein [Terriglobia bacterium]
MAAYRLPYQDELGFTNILLTALGGDGANMAAKLLFKIAVEALDLDGGYDAKYGSEKTGTPTDVSIRLCPYGIPVRESGPTRRPHMLSVFREKLIRSQNLVAGLQPEATVMANTTKAPAEIRGLLRLPSGKILTLDATRIALETKSRLNMPMLAVLTDQLVFPTDIVKYAIAKQWPKAKESNVDAFAAALGSVRSERFEPSAEYPLVDPARASSPIGYTNMLNGGAINALTNISVPEPGAEPLGRVPVFAAELCSHCGLCLVPCPDPGAIIWKDRKMLGINPAYCKGCMQCVEICPTTKHGKALKEPELVFA